MARKATTWSVKGIEEDVRDIARAAAERDEQTIGAWIDYAIRVHGGQRPRIEERHHEAPSDPEHYSLGQSAVATSAAASGPDPDALLALVDEELGASSRRLDSALRPMGLALLDLAERMVAMERHAPVQAEIPAPQPPADVETDQVFDDDFGPEALPGIRSESALESAPDSEAPETLQPGEPLAVPDIPPAPTFDLDGAVDGLDVPMLAQASAGQTSSADRAGTETDRAREIDRRLRALAGEVENAETDPPPPTGDLGPTAFDVPLPPRETAEPLELPMAFRGVQQSGFESHPGQAARESATRQRRRNARTGRRAVLAAITVLVVATAGLYAAADHIGLGRLKAEVDRRLQPGLETVTREAQQLWITTLDSAAPLLAELETMLLGGEEPESVAEPPVDEPRESAASEPLPPEPLPEPLEPVAPVADDASVASSPPPQPKTAPPVDGTVEETVDKPADASAPSEAGQASPQAPTPAPASAERAPAPKAAEPVPVPDAAPAGSVIELAPPPAPVLPERSERSSTGAEVAALPQSGTQSPSSLSGGLQQRADAGDATAQHDLAIVYLTGEAVPEDPARAAELLREAAIQGLASAQYNLAVLYETGQGVRKDDVRALLWYHSAAEQGHPNAQYNLGVMYAEGRGIPLNFEEAARWFRAAADQGVARALYNLGVMTDEGLGVTQDKAAALDLYRAAAGAGDERAIDLLAGSGYQSVAPQAPLSGAEGVQAVPATPAKLVTDVQRELARLGLYDGRIDGLIGPKTRAAIRGFQKSRGSDEDGEASQELLELLRAEAR